MVDGRLKTYLGQGPVADRPATPDTPVGTAAFWHDQATLELTIWDSVGLVWMVASLSDAAVDGVKYVRKDGAWLALPAYPIVPNVPGADGLTYAIVDGAWSAIVVTSYTDEQVRDVMGAALTQGAGITITVDDAGNIITVALTNTPERLGLLAGINTQTASYTLVLTDIGKVVESNVATANNITVPPNSSVAFPVNSRIDLAQIGAGQATVVAGAGVTIRSSGGKLKLTGQYSGASLYKRATDEWVLFGDIST